MGFPSQAAIASLEQVEWIDSSAWKPNGMKASIVLDDEAMNGTNQSERLISGPWSILLSPCFVPMSRLKRGYAN